MINIQVGNTPLYIPKETALVLEQSNNLFSDDGIMSDIIWSFEIPAKENQATLGAVQYMYCGNSRRYECEVKVDGILILAGYLYVQGSKDERQLTCGIVANSFGAGFGDKKLKEDDFGSPLVISETEDGHCNGWRSFLLESLSADSIYKFFAFVNSKFYKDNDDYGMYNGTESPLAESFVEDKGYTIGYVNRLFFSLLTQARNSFTPSIIEDSDSLKRGCRIFNKANLTAQNGYCFAPAIRLDWLVKKVFATAGLSVYGSFFQSEGIKHLYVQSLCAMDGSSTQYGARNSLTITNTQNSTVEEGSTQRFVSAETGEIASVFQHRAYPHKFNFSFELDQSELVRNATYGGEEGFELYDEIYAIAIMPKNGGTLPTWRMKAKQYNGDENTYDPFIYGHLKTISELKNSMYLDDDDDTISSVYKVDNGCAHFNYTHQGLIFSYNRTSNDIPIKHANSILIQITPSKSRPKNNLSEGYIRGELSMFSDAANVMCCHYNWNYILQSGQYVVRLKKLKVATSNTDISVRWSGYFSLMNVKLSAYGQMEKLYDYEDVASVPIVKTDPTLNIFSRILDWKQHVPNLTNSEFIETICKVFGLSFFVNPITKQAQLNFFSDTLKAGSLDISQWVTGREKMEYSPKKYNVALSPLLGEEKSTESNILKPITLKEETPSALLNQNKHIFVLNEAAFRQAEVDEKENKYSWPQCAGDSRTLSAGANQSDTSENVSIEVNTPNMTYADEGVPGVDEKYLCQIENKGCSPMLDKEYTGEFPLILQQYVGQRQIKAGSGEVYIEDANPTIYDKQGQENTSAISLSTIGRRSIGEMWLKPVYDFLGNCDHYRLTAHMPSWMFCKVMDTLRPQGNSPVAQVRWLYYKGQKVLPTKISSEVSERDTIVMTIECAAPHIEL